MDGNGRHVRRGARRATTTSLGAAGLVLLVVVQCVGLPVSGATLVPAGGGHQAATMATAPTAPPYTGGWIITGHTTPTGPTITGHESVTQVFGLTVNWNDVQPSAYITYYVAGTPTLQHVNLAVPLGQSFRVGVTYSTSENGVGLSIGRDTGSQTTHVCVGEFRFDALTYTASDSDTAVGLEFDGTCGVEGIAGELAEDLPNDGGAGYYLYMDGGSVTGRGNNQFLTYFGNLGSQEINAPVRGMAVRPTGGGYWLVASDGGIFAFGDAPFYGSMGGVPLNEPIVDMAPTPSGNGYWLVASDGGMFAFGDAQFYGSMGGMPLNEPIVGMAPTPDGRGYWLVASDGGIFAFGDAQFYGSTGSIALNEPIVGMAPTPSGGGYWLVASDGGIFAFGDAPYDGSLYQPVQVFTGGASGSPIVGGLVRS